MKKTQVSAALFAAGILSTTSLWAQDAALSAEADAEGEAGMEAESESEPAPLAEPAPMAVAEPAPISEAPQPETGESDHDGVVGHIGVGYMGRQSMTIGADRETVFAPIIGARYWLSDMIGIDAGLGLNIAGGRQTETGAEDVSKTSTTVFFVHAGVPLNLADVGHFSFQVIPEMNFGIGGTGDQDPSDAGEFRDSGIHFSAGARAGGEIHFGFMGVPQLSLTGSVGLFFQHETGRSKAQGGGTEFVQTDSTNSLGTTLGPDPWDLFTGSISALYYF